MPVLLDPKTRAFYRKALTLATDSGIPFLLGGAYAMARYTGIERHTKDLDVFARRSDARRLLELFQSAGYLTELTYPHWLGKVFADDAFVDVIFGSGNGLCEVDDDWFRHSVDDHVLECPVRLLPAEEMIWSKSFIMERERFDGADVAHLILSRGDQLNWRRLLDRFGEHWRVLHAHVILFDFIYPSERRRIPEDVRVQLHHRQSEDRTEESSGSSPICRGTLLSRSQYLDDLTHGYTDARLQPNGRMTANEIRLWTESIAVDGSL